MSFSDGWQAAIRYQEIRSQTISRERKREIRRWAASAIIHKAQALMGALVRPGQTGCLPESELPADAHREEIELEETIENSFLNLGSEAPLTPGEIWMSFEVHRKQPVVLAVDTSLSMTGEKIALTAVALAVVLLQFPDDPIGMLSFENHAKILKRPTESISVWRLIERFLDSPAQGYTHLEEGMATALRLSAASAFAGKKGPASTLLLTDGKYTAGRDPTYMASKFNHLVVLKMGRDRASLEFCRRLAQTGRGRLLEVGELESLPSVMYEIVKDLLRGRSST